MLRKSKSALKLDLRCINQFIASQSAGGVLLALAALVALIISNSPWQAAYQQFLDIPFELRIGTGWLVLTGASVWINDLCLAVFFFFVRLEFKREMLRGELASPAQGLLPAGAALGGMLVPALI